MDSILLRELPSVDDADAVRTYFQFVMCCYLFVGPIKI